MHCVAQNTFYIVRHTIYKEGWRPLHQRFCFHLTDLIMVQNVFSQGHMCFWLHVFSFLGHNRRDKRQWKQLCSFISIPWTLLEPPWGPAERCCWCCCCCWWCWWWRRWSRPWWPEPPSDPAPIKPTPAPPLFLTKSNTLIWSFFSWIASVFANFLSAEKK